MIGRLGRSRLAPLDALEVLAGLGLLVWGAADVSPALAKALTGVLLFVFGLWGRRIV